MEEEGKELEVEWKRQKKRNPEVRREPEEF